MSFAKNLKELRVKKGLLQEDLAAKLHISRQSISRYENGTAEPSIDMLNDISIILDTSIDLLIDTKKEIAEYRQFNLLNKTDKKLLWYDFAKKNRLYTFIMPFILLMINNLGIAIIVFFATNMANTVYNSESRGIAQIMAIAGAFLIVVAVIILFLRNSIICSLRFNRWLKIEHNILRHRKLMII